MSFNPWRCRFGILIIVFGLQQLTAIQGDEVGVVIKQIHSHHGLVGRNGKNFVLNGEPFYVNGWNSYWLMTQAVEEHTRSRVVSIFKHGAALGMTVCRTWAFNDASYDALQMTPGAYSEKTFQVDEMPCIYSAMLWFCNCRTMSDIKSVRYLLLGSVYWL